MKFPFNDGGRAAAGYKSTAGDCVARSIAIATGKPYLKVYGSLKKLAEKERITKRRKNKSSVENGVHRVTYDKYLKSIGWKWVATMKIGNGCKVHLNDEELPGGRLIVRVSKHITAVIDGVINDTYDCSRRETRCVYGYYYKGSRTKNRASEIITRPQKIIKAEPSLQHAHKKRDTWFQRLFRAAKEAVKF